MLGIFDVKKKSIFNKAKKYMLNSLLRVWKNSSRHIENINNAIIMTLRATWKSLQGEFYGLYKIIDVSDEIKMWY